MRTPVLVALGERDVLVDPRGETRAYESSPSVDFFSVPAMAHMHNFAGTRELFWQRIEDVGGLGADWTAAERRGMRRPTQRRRGERTSSLTDEGGRMRTGGTGKDGVMELELADDLPSLLRLERVDRACSGRATPTSDRARRSTAGRWRPSASWPPRPPSRTGPAPPLVPRVLLASGADRPARRAAGRAATATGAPSRPATSWRYRKVEVIFSMLTSFHAERESGALRRRAAPAGAGARGHAQGWPDGAGRGARGDADRLPQRRLHRLASGPVRRRPWATTRCCIGLR